MKKILPYLIYILLAVSIVGCNQKTYHFEETKIYQLQYKNQSILEEEYKDILEILKEIPFTQEKKYTINEPDLIITTENNIYKFQKKDNIIYYYQGKETYQTKKGEKLYQKLDEIDKKYQNQNFYQIEVNDKAEENSTLIKLDSSDTYLKITTSLPIHQFKIHSIEDNQDIDLLYENELIPQDKTIYIRYNPTEKEGKIRITFTSPYQYQISIIPSYDEKTKEIIFDKTFVNKQK